VVQPRATKLIAQVASLRETAGKVPEISSLGRTSGSDADKFSEKNEDFDEKKGDVIFESPIAEYQRPSYGNHPDAKETEAIHHPADKDDILTHSIHVEDDPTLNSITFRTLFLGTFLLSHDWGS
jgi:hypothetical protein